MVVVADTGPLNYLIQIDYVDVLRKLYQQILIPQEVRSELLHYKAPDKVRSWVAQRPDWCQIVAVDDPPLPSLLGLDHGERAAIQLALAVHADAVLIDETAGRRLAVQHGLSVRGTLGVLKAASLAGHIDLRTAIAALVETNFNVSESLIEQILRAE